MRLSCAILFLVLFGHSSDALACTCMAPGPPCQNVFRSDAVFVGTVRDIVLVKVQESVTMANRRLVTFEVDRVGRGKVERRAEVHPGLGGGDCGIAFKVGQRYIVYAYRRSDDSLGTRICSRTKLASEAAEDIAYLDALPASGTGARIAGEIKHAIAPAGPVDPIRLVLQSR